MKKINIFILLYFPTYSLDVSANIVQESPMANFTVLK